MPTPATPVLHLAPAWQTLVFASDIHLHAQAPRTFELWAHFMRTVQADALFLLGDLFEVWIGDDALNDPAFAFERACTALIQACSQRMPVYVMHGNRDFLMGPGFEAASGAHCLADPTVLDWGGQRLALSHGDAWCVDDTDYQAFRRTVRDQTWQTAFLAQPLAQRAALAKAMRQASEARHAQTAQSSALWADVDAQTAAQALTNSHAHTLIHGHTHRPGHGPLGPDLQRWVLSDWDVDAPMPRASFLRWHRNPPHAEVVSLLSPTGLSA